MIPSATLGPSRQALFTKLLADNDIPNTRQKGCNINGPKSLTAMEIHVCYAFAQAWYGIATEDRASAPPLTEEELDAFFRDAFSDSWDVAEGTCAVPDEPPRVKSATEVEIGTWQYDLPLSTKSSKTPDGLYRHQGDPAFMSITLSDKRTPYLWEVRDFASKLSNMQHVRLNPGITLMDAQAMCIANHDKYETRRAKDYNRAYAREMVRQLFMKFSQEGSNGDEPIIGDAYKPDAIIKPVLAEPIFRELLISIPQLLEKVQHKRKLPLRSRLSMIMAKLALKRKRDS